MNRVILQDIKLTHRNPLDSYTLTMRKQKEKLRKQYHSPLQQRIRYLGIYLPKETKDLYMENYKTLMKEIKEDTNRWRNIPCSWIRRINIVKMSILHTKQSIDSMQSLSSYQHNFFTELEQIMSQFVWKYKKTSNS